MDRTEGIGVGMDFEKETASRLSYLESEFTSLMGALRTSEQSRSRWEERVESKLDSITSKRTDWGVLISAATIGVVIGVLVLTPVYSNLARLETEVVALESSVGRGLQDINTKSTKRDETQAATFATVVSSIYELGQKRDDDLANWLLIIDTEGPRSANKQIAKIRGLEQRIRDMEISDRNHDHPGPNGALPPLPPQQQQQD
jgi:hypothetical protein